MLSFLYVLITKDSDCPVATKVTFWLGKSTLISVLGSAIIAANKVSAKAAETCTGKTPTFKQLFLKISANADEITQRNPKSYTDQAACSLEEPEPKFLPPTNILEPA